MRITKLSAEPLGKLYSWLPAGLNADHVLFLPDACPGKSPPVDLQQRFAKRVEAVHCAKAVHQFALAELGYLFASLQASAFAGDQT